MNSQKHRGFSLLEMLIVVSIGLVLAGISVISLMPILKKEHIDAGYETTLMVLRNTRHLAITQGHEYIVTFNPAGFPAGTIEVQYQPSAVGGIYPVVQLVNTYRLPPDVGFATQTGFPASTPDGFGSAVLAIDFGYTPTGGAGGSNLIVFMPDGSARDGSSPGNGGNYSSGVVYLIRTSGSITDSRAITVWGATGRIRGWTLADYSGTKKWLQK